MTIASRFSPLGGVPDRVFKATFAIPADGLTLDFQFANATFSNPVDIDWGDGTTETLFGGSGIDIITYQHTYSSAGNYQITLKSGTGKIPRLRCWGQGKIRTIDESRVTWTTGNNITTTFQAMFRGASVQSVPKTLFVYNPSATDFSALFYAAQLLSIPEGLFDENKQAMSMATLFYYDRYIPSIPADLFKYQTEVYSYQGTFFSCKSITSIPSGLFNASTGVTNFRDVFRDTGITNIPSGLFDVHTKAQNFYASFSTCPSLQSAPSELFKNCTLATNFNSTFSGCVKMTIPEDIFCATTDKATRFASVTPDFTSFFSRASWSGSVAGTAPDLWNYTFSGTPTTTGCYGGAGNSATSLTNYADIPAAWK